MSKTGNATNNESEGITNQNILVERELIFSTSFVSIYNHIMANTDISGIEASIEAIKELRFDISEIATINRAVMIIFIT